MLYEDEKDYIMRMIKEMVRVLFSLMLGKQYTQVELPGENRFLVSGKNLGDLKEMADRGRSMRLRTCCWKIWIMRIRKKWRRQSFFMNMWARWRKAF